MTTEDLKEKIRGLALEVVKDKKKADYAAVEYDELTRFPELKDILVSLLTADFDPFLSSIDWVAPRPTTFRINLKNGESFYLIWMRRSWIAEVEGKKYYLLNLPEEQKAAESIARLLRYGPTGDDEAAEGESEFGAGAEEVGDEEVDVDVEDETEVEVEI
jgi:hypothetical protein